MLIKGLLFVNGNVVVYFAREKDRKTFVVYRGPFVFNRTKKRHDENGDR